MSGLAPTFPLRNGADIPVLGLGTSPLQGAESATQVRTALEAGYRLIDTAENYRNEDAVGQAIRDSGIDRSEVFITTKFNRRWHSVDGVRQAYEASLERLGVDYIDLCWCTGRTRTKIATSMQCKACRQFWTTVDSAPSARRISNRPTCSECSMRPASARCQPDPAQPILDQERQPGVPRSTRHCHRVVQPAWRVE